MSFLRDVIRVLAVASVKTPCRYPHQFRCGWEGRENGNSKVERMPANWTPVFFEDVSGGVTRETIVEWAKKTPAVLAVSRETGEDDDEMRPHFHLAIQWDKAIDRKTHLSNIHRAFPNMKAGKTGMSNREWDGSTDLYNYIFKGNKKNRNKGFDCVFVRGDIDPAKHHKMWHDIYEENEKHKRKETSEERKERFIKETIQHFKNRKPYYGEVSKYLFNLYRGRVMLNHLQPMALHCLYELDPPAANEIHERHVLAWFDRLAPPTKNSWE